MASGPEHYREAEGLLEVAMSTSSVRPNADPINLAAAQVHATLALTAATAEPIAKSYDGDDFREYAKAWSEAIS